MRTGQPDWTERSQRLLEASEAGDAAAIGELLELFRAYLVSIAEQEMRQELRAKVNSSDVVQDAFLEACRIFSRFRGSQGGELQAWLRGILLNKLRELNHHYFGTEKRDVGREQSLEDSSAGSPLNEALPAPGSTPSGTAARGEDQRRLHEALGRLPEHYRQVIVWRHFEGISFVEVGRRLQRSEDAARMLYGRAFEYLQEELGQGHEP
jgi:RNA polymerase sigma-70 factor (ECF subfamily)